MTPEQSAAYVNGMAAALNAEVAGMVAENAYYALCGRAPPFRKEHFDAAINNYGVHHNSILTTFQQAQG